MAYVEDMTVTPTDGACGATFTIVVKASFTRKKGRQICVRIPEGADCTFGDGSIKVCRDVTANPSVVTFRQQMRCSASGRTSFLLYAQASEEAGTTHEKYRTVSVTC